MANGFTRPFDVQSPADVRRRRSRTRAAPVAPVPGAPGSLQGLQGMGLPRVQEMFEQAGINTQGFGLQGQAVGRTRNPRVPGALDADRRALIAGGGLSSADIQEDPFGTQFGLDRDAIERWNRHLQGTVVPGLQGPSLAPAVDPFAAKDTFVDWLASQGLLEGFDISADPFFQGLQQSVTGTLQNPDVISAQEAGLLKGAAADTIRGNRATTLQNLQESAVRRGTLDSSAQAAISAQTEQQAGRDIAESARQVDIDRALAREQNRARAQQIASALTGQTLQGGIAGQQLGLQGAGLGLQAGQLALGQGAQDISRFGAERAQAGQVAGVQLLKDFPVRDVLSQHFDERSVQQAEEALEDMKQSMGDAEGAALFWSIIQMILPFVIGD